MIDRPRARVWILGLVLTLAVAGFIAVRFVTLRRALHDVKQPTGTIGPNGEVRIFDRPPPTSRPATAPVNSMGTGRLVR